MRSAEILLCHQAAHVVSEERWVLLLLLWGRVNGQILREREKHTEDASVWISSSEVHPHKPQHLAQSVHAGLQLTLKQVTSPLLTCSASSHFTTMCLEESWQTITPKEPKFRSFVPSLQITFLFAHFNFSGLCFWLN